MKFIACLLLFVSLQLTGFAQSFKVDYIHGYNEVYSLSIIDGNAWVGGHLGLGRINTANYTDREVIIDPFVDVDQQQSCFWTLCKGNSKNEIIASTGDCLYTYKYGRLHLAKSGLMIYSFLFDEFDNLWILNGFDEVIKYDKNWNETRYTANNSSLPSCSYHCLYVKNNILWLGTDYGLVRFDGVNSEITTIPNVNIVTSISIDNDNNLWMACHTFGNWPEYDKNYSLVKKSGQTLTIYNKYNSPLPNTTIYTTAVQNGNIYLGTSNGLVLFDGNTWHNYTVSQNNLISDEIHCINFENDKVWLGTTDGISVLSEDTTINIKLNNITLTGAYQGPIAEDKQGNIWIGTSGSIGNLSRFDGTNWKVFVQGSVNDDQSFYSIATDSSNTVWASTYTSSGSLYSIRNDSMTTYNLSELLGIEFLMDIVVDKYNNKWILSSDKLLKFDGSSWTIYKSSDFSHLHMMHTMATDHQGNIWIGAGQDGLIKFDGVNWTHYSSGFFGHNYSEIGKIIVDSLDHLWLDYSHSGQEPSIIYFDGTSLTWYNTNINLPAKGLGLLSVEKDGSIWYGAETGLAKYNGTEWTYYNRDNSRLLNDITYDFFIDSKNYKWVSSDCYIARFKEDRLYYEDDTIVILGNSRYTLFPNPSRNIVYLHPNYVVDSPVVISLFNSLGALIFTRNYLTQDDINIDLSGFTKGIYYFRLKGNNFTEDYKVCKM